MRIRQGIRSAGIILGMIILIFSGCSAGREAAAREETGTAPAGTVEKEDNPRRVMNILLIGQDRRPGEDRSRSDAMILCSVDSENRRIVFTSFLRDLYVEIPGYGKERLNVPYVLGGMELLDRTLEENYGVQVQGNVEVDFDGFFRVIDTLGGVDVALSREEADYLNTQLGAGEEEKLREGVNCLSGKAALAYCRIRYLDSDFGRTQRQRRVLEALVEKGRELPAGEVLRLCGQLSSQVTTDMSGGQILSLAAEVFPILRGMTVVSQQIPVEGTFRETTVDGMDVIVADETENRAFLACSIYGK